MDWVTNKTLILTIIISLTSTLAALGNQPLKGSVELAEHLPALDPTLSPGSTFDQSAATALLGQRASENLWYKIPTWLAGHWQCSEAVTIYSKDENTGKEDTGNHPHVLNSTETWGNFPTKDGWWQYGDSNYWTTTGLKDSVGHAFIQRFELTDIKNDGLTIKSDSTQFYLNRKTNKITLVTQRESILVYRRITDTLFRENEYHSNYDWTGQLIYTARNTSNSKKISNETYKRTPEKLALLTRFLNEHGMSDEIKNIR